MRSSCGVVFLVLFFTICVFSVVVNGEVTEDVVVHSDKEVEVERPIIDRDVVTSDISKDEESFLFKFFKKNLKKCGNVGDSCLGTSSNLGCCYPLLCIDNNCQQCFSPGEDCTENSDCCLDRCSNDGVCCISDLGDSCISSADCCRGFCHYNTCVEQSCVEVGLYCNDPTDCCQGSCYENRCCVSESIGDDCETTADCCYGYCDDITLRCRKACAVNGEDCREDRSCCSQRCEESECVDLCEPVGAACSTGSDCCSGNCNIDICCAITMFNECEDNDDCNTAHCIDNVCQFQQRDSCPLGVGVSCQDATDCEQLVCNDDGLCVLMP